jgi:hypothetical protein
MYTNKYVESMMVIVLAKPLKYVFIVWLNMFEPRRKVLIERNAPFKLMYFSLSLALSLFLEFSYT